jgi:NAD(P)H dehydrogenase (quinone)
VNVLIVHAHNEPQSFNAALKDLATVELQAQGHTVQISDLYAMNWNPVASAADFGQRTRPDYLVYALEQRHGHANGTLAADILGELDKLGWADLVIFNFPLYGGTRFYDKGGLKGKRAMMTLTLGGQPHMLQAGGVHDALDDMLRPLLRGTLGYVGLTVLPPFAAYHVPYIAPEERTAMLEDYRVRLRSLDDVQPLHFPSLDQFDDKLYPR